jgi:monovalent cation/hydrogen antiporter
MPQMSVVQVVLALVGLATLVAVAARKLSVPAPSLLVVAGLLIGLLPGAPAIHLPPDIVGLLVLPPLVYAAGEELSLPALRTVWKPVVALAVGLVGVSAVAVAAVTVSLTGLSWSGGLLLGAVLASTDPVAVTALGRRLSLPAPLQALVQSESLFNDATSLILFRIAVAAAVGTGVLSPATAAGELLMLGAGGAAVGAVGAVLIGLLRKVTDDPLVEAVISLVTPYLIFVAAERIGGSGITAVVVASIVLGGLAPRITTPTTRLQLHAVHSTNVFVLESVVFALIGLQLPTLIREDHSEHWLVAAAAIAVVLIIVRVAWVFPLAAVQRRRTADGSSRWRASAVVSWAGARGVVPLAAALSIPLATETNAALPGRSTILVLAIAVIVISLLTQGFTLQPLVRWAGIGISVDQKALERDHAWERLTQIGLDHLDQAAASQDLDVTLVEQARRAVNATADIATSQPDSATELYRHLRRAILHQQLTGLHDMAARGQISDSLRRTIQHQLDLEIERLRSH